MKRRLMYFFSMRDEEEVSAFLCKEFPRLKFIDGQRWPTVVPPTVEGIHRCASGIAYLWPSDLAPELPSVRRSSSEYQGASSGPVIQFIRCRQREGKLEMSQLSAFIEDAGSPLGRAHARLIAVLKKRYACPLNSYNSRSGRLMESNLRGYLVGPSLRNSPETGPRLVLGFGRDEYMIPADADA